MKKLTKNASGVYSLEGVNSISKTSYNPRGMISESIEVTGDRVLISYSLDACKRIMSAPKNGIEHRVHRALLKAQAKL